jgi:D-alanyl-D-alanine carboxypeptidase
MSKPDLNETLTIGEEDVDIIKGTRSRLKVGTRLAREEMLRLALMSSENRAASALSRHYPGGREAFVAAMNRKAQALGLADTRFQDATGLTAANVSSPRDLAKMVDAAHQYPADPRILDHSETASSASPVARSNSATPIPWSRARPGKSACPRPATSTRPASAW